MTDNRLPKQVPEQDAGLVVAVLFPGTGLDDLIRIVREAQLQCLNVTVHDPASDYAELLEYSLSENAIGILFVFSPQEYEVVYESASLPLLEKRLQRS